MKYLITTAVRCILLIITFVVQSAHGQTPIVFKPSSTSQLRFGGYAKLDWIFDFDDVGDDFQFDPRVIPLDGEDNPQLTLHTKQTRLNISYDHDTDFGPLTFFVEGDFFGQNGSFRLRHAYGQWDNWLAGNTWSTLVDIDSAIETLDIAGADGPINIRRPQLRWNLQCNDLLSMQLSMEENTTILAANVAGETRNRVPVFASGIRLGDNKQHLYWFNGISESRFVALSGVEERAIVWSTGLSGRYTFSNGDSIVGRVLGGNGADGLVNFEPSAIAISSVATLGGYFFDTGYRHHWSNQLRSNIAYRISGRETDDTRPETSLRRTQYIATNLIWRPISNVDIGIEYLFGERLNRVFQTGSANRLQCSFIWRLP